MSQFEKLDKCIRIGRTTMRISETLHDHLISISHLSGHSTMLCALRAAASEGAPILARKITKVL